MNPNDDSSAGGDLPRPIPDATARPEDILKAAAPAAPASAAASASQASAGASPLPGRYEHVIKQFAHDYLRDRRGDRRWKTFFRLIWVSVLLLFIVVDVRDQAPWWRDDRAAHGARRGARRDRARHRGQRRAHQSPR